jgi:flagellar motor switch/type III secretory pathway protein FliN
MKSEPFLLLGESRRQALIERISRDIGQWQRSWLPDRELPVRVDVVEARGAAVDIRTMEGATFRARVGKEMPLALIVPARSMPVLAGAHPSGMDATSRFADEHSLAATLEREALRRLATALLGGSNAELEHCAGTSAEMLRELGAARYLRAGITLGERTLLIALLSPAFVETVAPRRSAAATAERVERRRAAALIESVAVEALLGNAEVTVSELAALALGDVIVLDRKLTDAGDLSVRNGERIGDITLGQLDGRRAVQIRGGKT